MERVVAVCFNNGQTSKSATILVRDGSFVRFAILEACNALRVRYDKRLGLFRLNHGKYYPWVHPNARFPLIKQSEEEVFEIKICNDPDYRSNMNVIRLKVENIDDPDPKPVLVQMNTETWCYMIPIMYRKLSRQKIEKANEWKVLINGNELVDGGEKLSEYEINDGDTVKICREVSIEDPENDSQFVWL